jgi:hypothetical protein
MNNVQDKTDTWKIVKFMECLEPIWSELDPSPSR